MGGVLLIPQNVNGSLNLDRDIMFLTGCPKTKKYMKKKLN